MWHERHAPDKDLFNAAPAVAPIIIPPPLGIANIEAPNPVIAPTIAPLTTSGPQNPLGSHAFIAPAIPPPIPTAIMAGKAKNSNDTHYYMYI
uniref:Uncharacterized protein n=1 Tax=Aliivibrio wodanis TaxID=80852 RepID=A0A5Q4Z483_9GAMM|nr:hypothetical protein AW0309160_01248 [Aliivibrio wodanis]